MPPTAEQITHHSDTLHRDSEKQIRIERERQKVSETTQTTRIVFLILWRETVILFSFIMPTDLEQSQLSSET